MARGKAEDAGGLTPAKDDNAAPYHFAPRTLPIFKCVDYNIAQTPECAEDVAAYFETLYDKLLTIASSER